MENVSSIRNSLLGSIAVLLILAQSIFATTLPSFHAEFKKPEIKKEITSKVSYAEAVTRVSVPSFFFYWMAKATAVDISHIDYHNCMALFVNSHSFNIFYIFTSALAP
jgi:hypothetical protein